MKHQFSKIEWTDFTFNPWHGCNKVSDECDHCYAESDAKRRKRGTWGKDGARWFPSEHYWRDPLRWNERARRLGRRYRVFCASMADVFENRSDLDAQRQRLWDLIVATPWLDWLLLTKRPGLIMRKVPSAWREDWPLNVWVGTTVGHQRYAEQRLKHLLRVPAPVRFASCEPLLSQIDLTPHLGPGRGKLNWVIGGGESGARSRPSHPEWFRSLRDQCVTAGIPFFLKQWGNWAPSNGSASSKKRRHLTIFGEQLVRSPSKYDSGRELDGRTWDEIPVVRFPREWPMRSCRFLAEATSSTA